YDDKPQRGDRFLATLSPLRGSIQNDTLPTGLRPWLRSVAAPRLNRGARARQREALIKDVAIAAIFVPKLIFNSWFCLEEKGGHSTLRRPRAPVSSLFLLNLIIRRTCRGPRHKI